MANSAQAKKRAIQAEKRTLNNASQKSAMRTLIKKVLKSLAGNNVTEAKAEYQKTAKALDIIARRKIISPNKAARIKSRLNSKIKAAAQQ